MPRLSRRTLWTYAAIAALVVLIVAAPSRLPIRDRDRTGRWAAQALSLIPTTPSPTCA